MRRAMLLCVLLGGCAVGPNYQRPDDANVPGRFRSMSEVYMPAVSPTAPWWQEFNDPILNRLMQQARENSPDIARAQAAVAAARAVAEQAAAGGRPSVNASAGYLYNRPFQGRQYKPDWTATYGFDAGWELDLWGKTRRAVEAGQAQLQATEASAEDATLTLLAEIARWYISLRSAQEQLEIVTESERNRQRDLRDTQVRFEAREALIIETLQAETALLQTRSTIPSLRLQIQVAENALAVLTGQPPTGLNLPAAKMPQAEMPRVGIPYDLLRRRPDVRVAERNLAAATAQVGVAVANQLPSFSIGGSISLSGTSLAAPVFSLGPSLNIPLLDGGVRSAVVRQRRAQLEEAQQVYRSTVLQALQDVEDAISRVRADRQQIARLQTALRVARRSAAAARQIYVGGGVEFLQVLTARQTLDSLLLSLAQAEASLATNTVSLYKALAGGYRLQ